jgi:hypothetical protein
MASNKRRLEIINYTEYPGPRYCNQGDCSGEDFYHKKLNSAFAIAISEGVQLEVNLDKTAGYASSFLDEAFGNLIYDFSEELVRKILVLVSEQEPDWKQMILDDVFIDWEERRISHLEPKKTENHEEWFRFEQGRLIKKKWISI